jgi:hypothetical protein
VSANPRYSNEHLHLGTVLINMGQWQRCHAASFSTSNDKTASSASVPLNGRVCVRSSSQRSDPYPDVSPWICCPSPASPLWSAQPPSNRFLLPSHLISALFRRSKKETKYPELNCDAPSVIPGSASPDVRRNIRQGAVVNTIHPAIIAFESDVRRSAELLDPYTSFYYLRINLNKCITLLCCRFNDYLPT